MFQIVDDILYCGSSLPICKGGRKYIQYTNSSKQIFEHEFVSQGFLCRNSSVI